MIDNTKAVALCDLFIPAGAQGEPAAGSTRAPSYLLEQLKSSETEEVASLLKELSGNDLNESLLRGLEETSPTAFSLLVRYVYEGYYSDPAVVAQMDLPGSPQPKGHDLEPFDPNLMASLRSAAEVAD